MKRILTVAAVTALAAAAGASEPADGPGLVYAGTVTAADGLALGSVPVRVALYADGEGGDPVCAGPDAEADAAGRFSVEMPCADAVQAHSALWIGVTADGVDLPRTRIGAAPYALRAVRADTATGASGALAEAIGGLQASAAKVDALAGKVAAVEAASGKWAEFSDLFALAGQVAGLDKQIAGTASKADLGVVKAQVAALQSSVDALAADVKALPKASAVDAIAGKVSAVEGKIGVVDGKVAALEGKPGVKCVAATPKMEVPVFVQSPGGSLLIIVNARISGFANIGTPSKYQIRVNGKPVASADAALQSQYEVRLDTTALAEVQAGQHAVELAPVDGQATCGQGNCRVTVCAIP